MSIYIRCEEGIRRLEAASILKQNVYIFGATGYGKTRMVKEFLGNRSYCYFSLNNFNSTLSLLDQVLESEEMMTVVIDDLHELTNEEDQQRVIRCLSQENLWVILISRGAIPSWLFTLSIEKSMMLVPENCFYISENQYRNYLKDVHLNLDEDTFRLIYDRSEQHAMILVYLTQIILSGKKLDENEFYQARRLFFNHLQKVVIDRWPVEISRFLAAMSIVEEFTLDQAIMMTGNLQLQEIINRSIELGTFLRNENGHYVIRKQLVEVFQENMEQFFSVQEVKEFIFLAGRYLEMHQEDLKALELYARYNFQAQIHSLLVRNSQKTPDVGFFFEMRKYYFMLSNEEISHDVYLMSGMSMLSSICMDVETSEFWYTALKEYQKSNKGIAHREATKQLAYLDIALPHRGSSDILSLIRSTFTVFRNNSLPFPEFSVTGNIPSLMNGGKDFCDWSKQDGFLASHYGKMISTFLGKYGKGMVNTALAESALEKGKDLQLVSNYITKAKIEQSSDVKSQMQFALLGIQVRYSFSSGELEWGKQIIRSFEQENQDNMKFRPNLDALKCRFSLLSGDLEKIRAFLCSSRDETESFCTLFRYIFMIRIRCYLALKEYEKAAFLIQIMKHYAKENKRQYIEMELGLLDTILLYRQGKAWEDTLMTTLVRLAEFGFVRVIAEECGAIYNLLDQIQPQFMSEYPQYEEWFSLVFSECGKMSRRYKKYLSLDQEIHQVELLPFDVRVLSCLADGMSIPQTAEVLKINFETLRSRLKEIYKRLGAKNKTEAILIAQSMNMI